jgi:hypothetical protein
MTNQELDDWIILKTDTLVIFEKMRGNNVTAMVNVHFYVNRLTDQFGGEPITHFLRVREALIRLLKAKRICVSGVNGWTTNPEVPATLQRHHEAEMVLSGQREWTSDLTPAGMYA